MIIWINDVNCFDTSNLSFHSTILVQDLAGTSLHTREVAKLILQAVAAEPFDQVELDFSGIDFISRSFADDFHFNRLRLQADQHKRVTVTHAAPEVAQILQAVTRVKRPAVELGRSRIPVLRFDNRKDLNYYLVSL